jgi:hypothetical protein
MEEKAILLRFVRFLKRNSAYKKYVINIQQLHGLSYRRRLGKKINVVEYILHSLIYENGEFLISDAFKWSDTIEGETYWRDINTKWYDMNDYDIIL